MKIGIVLYPTFGGSGVVATELGKALAAKGHQVHFITYSQPVRLGSFRENIFLPRGIHNGLSTFLIFSPMKHNSPVKWSTS